MWPYVIVEIGETTDAKQISDVILGGDTDPDFQGKVMRFKLSKFVDHNIKFQVMAKSVDKEFFKKTFGKMFSSTAEREISVGKGTHKDFHTLINECV